MLDELSLAIAGALLALAILIGLGGRQIGILRRRLSRAEAERDRAIAAEDSSNRALRLAGTELRGSALALLGQADHLHTGSRKPAMYATAISVLSAQIFSIADELQDHGVPTARSRVLHVEPLQLDGPVSDAIASVSTTLGPSRRRWSIDPALSRITVMADRRAFDQVFLRVLTNAARFSRDDDKIVISLLQRPDHLTVVVADAATIADAERGTRASPPGGGTVGLGLAMARVLMQAHGGDLHTASVPRFGTCVTLTLPASRIAALEKQTA